MNLQVLGRPGVTSPCTRVDDMLGRMRSKDRTRSDPPLSIPDPFAAVPVHGVSGAAFEHRAHETPAPCLAQQYFQQSRPLWAFTLTARWQIQEAGKQVSRLINNLSSLHSFQEASSTGLSRDMLDHLGTMNRVITFFMKPDEGRDTG